MFSLFTRWVERLFLSNLVESSAIGDLAKSTQTQIDSCVRMISTIKVCSPSLACCEIHGERELPWRRDQRYRQPRAHQIWSELGA